MIGRIGRFVRNLVLDWFKGPGNRYWSLTRAFVFGAGTLLFFYQGWDTIVLGHGFDAASFGAGLAAIAGCIAATAVQDVASARARRSE